MPNFTPMGAVPDFYSQIMGDASRNLVRMPDGSYKAAPQFPAPSSVNDVYAGMYSPGAIQPQSAADARSEQNMTRQTAQRPMVPNNWGTSIGRMMDPIWENNDPGTIMTAAAMPQIPGPSGFSNLNKSQDRLGAGTGLAFAGDEQQQNPALGAIDQLTGSGRSTASPFPMPSFRSPLYSPPMDSGNSLVGPRDQAWVDQGPDMAALGAISSAGVPMPRARPNLPTMPFPQSPMVRAGRQAPVPMPSPAFRNQSATVFDPSTGSFVTGRQPPPLPKRPSAAVKKQLKAQQNGGNSSPKPAGYGSKGYSEAGRALQALYGN